MRYDWTPRGELAGVYDAAVRRCATLLTMINTGAGWCAPLRRQAGDALPLRRHRARAEQRNPAGLSYTYQYEKNRISSPTA